MKKLTFAICVFGLGLAAPVMAQDSFQLQLADRIVQSSEIRQQLTTIIAAGKGNDLALSVSGDMGAQRTKDIRAIVHEEWAETEPKMEHAVTHLIAQTLTEEEMILILAHLHNKPLLDAQNKLEGTGESITGVLYPIVAASRERIKQRIATEVAE